MGSLARRIRAAMLPRRRKVGARAAHRAADLPARLTASRRPSASVTTGAASDKGVPLNLDLHRIGVGCVACMTASGRLGRLSAIPTHGFLPQRHVFVAKIFADFN